MRRITALIFDGFELLDLFGPLEMFGVLPEHFEMELVAEMTGPVASGAGPQAVATRAIAEVERTDILLIPGGPGTRRLATGGATLDWIAKTSLTADYTLSVCTGSALLARAGVLDAKRATTNKAAFAWVAEQGPKVLWQRQARWVEDGPFLTSSGVSAGIDMALAAIARMHGRTAADRAAREAEYTWNDDPAHDPFADVHGLA
jgi:putative intracellular protease/amidase